MPRRLTALAKSFRTSKMLRQSLLVFISTFAANALSYVFQFVASHRLGVANYGTLSALIAVVNVAIVPAAIALTVVVKYAAEFRATDDLAHLKRLVDAILTYAGLAAVAVAGAGAALAPVVGNFLHIPDRPAIVLCFVLLGLNLVAPVLRGVMQGVEDYRSYVVSIVVEAAGKSALGVLAAFAGFGTAGMIAGWSAGSAMSLLYSAVVLKRRYRDVPDAPLFVDARRLALTMVNVSLATLVITSLNNADLIVVKHSFDERTAGLYGLVSLSGKTLLFLVSFVPTIVLPRAASAVASGRSPLSSLLQGTAMLGVLAGGSLAFYALAPALVIKVLGGAEYLDGVYLILPYAVSTVLFAALNAVVQYKIGIHRFDFVIPLVAIGVAEIAGMSYFHDTPLHVIQVMIAGNAIALAVCLFNINAPHAVTAAPVRGAASAA